MFGVYYRSNCVKNVNVLSVLLKFPLPLHFLRKKLYTLVWIQLETRQNFNKTKILNNILHSLDGELLMVQDLILALRADNVEACFILSAY